LAWHGHYSIGPASYKVLKFIQWAFFVGLIYKLVWYPVSAVLQKVNKQTNNTTPLGAQKQK